MKRIRSILFIVIGLISLFLGVSCYQARTGGSESMSYYGGDAYTGIQQASAQAANNVKQLSENTNKGFSFVLIVAGLTLIAIGGTGDFKNN